MSKTRKEDRANAVVSPQNRVIRGIADLRSARFGPMLNDYRRFLSETKPFAMENGQIRTATEIAERLHIGDLRQLTDDIKPAGFVSFFTVVRTIIYPDDSFAVDTALFLEATSATDLFDELSAGLAKKQREDEKPLTAHWLAEYSLEDEENPNDSVIVRLEMSIWSLGYRELADPAAVFVVRMRPGDPQELLVRPADCCRADNYENFLWNSGFAVAYAGPNIRVNEEMTYGIPIEVPFDLSKGEDEFAGEDCPGVYCSFSIPRRTITSEDKVKCYNDLRRIGFNHFREMVGDRPEEKCGTKVVDGVELTQYVVYVPITDTETEPIYIYKDSTSQIQGYSFRMYG